MDNGLISKQRYEIIDVLRGFAIAAILLIHSSNHFLYGVFPENEPLWLQGLNTNTTSLLYFLFEGKSYAIFAALFGLSYALQYDNQRKKGNDFAWRMVWRLVGLAFFGGLNAAFFAGGDPLVFYALCMILIIPLRKISDKWLIALCTILFLQPLELINHFTPILGNSYEIYYGELSPYVAQDDFFVMAWANITIGLKSCLLWAVEAGRYTQTLGLLLFGMLAYRKKWFLHETKTTILYLFGAVTMLYLLKHNFESDWLTMIYNLCFALLLISIIMFCHSKWEKWIVWTSFIKLGQMSLTNFVCQSIVCSFIFYPWGLHLAPKLGSALSVLVGIGVLVLQIIFSTLWLKYNRRGPLEELWHKMTWINSSKEQQNG